MGIYPNWIECPKEKEKNKQQTVFDLHTIFVCCKLRVNFDNGQESNKQIRVNSLSQCSKSASFQHVFWVNYIVV